MSGVRASNPPDVFSRPFNKRFSDIDRLEKNRAFLPPCPNGDGGENDDDGDGDDGDGGGNNVGDDDGDVDGEQQW